VHRSVGALLKRATPGRNRTTFSLDVFVRRAQSPFELSGNPGWLPLARLCFWGTGSKQQTLAGGMLMSETEIGVHSDPEILDGTPVFVGTRVPLQNLVDYLSAGDSLEDFLRSFPTVTREQAVAALEQAGEALSHVARVA
jgi:uncharacterized protein (DUF433 family)